MQGPGFACMETPFPLNSVGLLCPLRINLPAVLIAPTTLPHDSPLCCSVGAGCCVVQGTFWGQRTLLAFPGGGSQVCDPPAQGMLKQAGHSPSLYPPWQGDTITGNRGPERLMLLRCDRFGGGRTGGLQSFPLQALAPS